MLLLLLLLLLLADHGSEQAKSLTPFRGVVTTCWWANPWRPITLLLIFAYRLVASSWMDSKCFYLRLPSIPVIGGVCDS
jgi:hypothetical protein